MRMTANQDGTFNARAGAGEDLRDFDLAFLASRMARPPERQEVVMTRTTGVHHLNVFSKYLTTENFEKDDTLLSVVGVDGRLIWQR